MLLSFSALTSKSSVARKQHMASVVAHWNKGKDIEGLCFTHNDDHHFWKWNVCWDFPKFNLNQ